MLKSYSKKIIVFALIAIAIVGAVMYFVGKEPVISYDTVAVEAGEIVDEVTSTGSIAPSAKIKLQAEVSGKIRAIAVSEGMEVTKDQLLVELDAKDISAQILAQQAAVATAAAKLAELRAGLTQEEIALAERGVDTAQSRLAAAESAYTDGETSLENSERKLENAQAKAEALIDQKLTTFVADIDSAAIKADDAVYRLTLDVFSKQDLFLFNVLNSQAKTAAEGTRLQAKASVENIKNAANMAKALQTASNVKAQHAAVAIDLAFVEAHLEAVVAVLSDTLGVAEATLIIYKTNASTGLSNVSGIATALQADATNLDLQARLNETDVTIAEIAVADSRASLNAAERSVDTNMNALREAEAALALKRSGTRPEIISAQRAVVDAEQARLSGLRAEFVKRRISAPVDGTITLLASEVGESVQPGATVVVMNTKGALEIIANISEIDIAKVKIGDPVDVTLDAFSRDDHWTGKVIAIQPAETVVDNVIFYETRIRFSVEDPRLRSGMTANLTIETLKKEGVLRIPSRALHRDNGTRYVRVLNDLGFAEDITVTVGLETIDFAEIITGVEIGDMIITREIED